MPNGRIEHGTIDSPEIVTEVNDSGQWEVQDSDGNVIARFDQDQVVNLFSDLFDAANAQTVYDSSTQEVKADVNNSSTTTDDAVIGADGETGSLTVDGDQSDLHWELVERQALSSDAGKVQFTGLSIDKEYRLFYTTDPSTSGEDIGLTINDDTGANYIYFDSSSTQQSSQNEILLYTLTNNAGIAGTIHLTNVRPGTNQRTGVNHRPDLGGPFSRISDFGREGVHDSAEALTSVEFITTSTGVFQADVSVFELWERGYA